MMTDMNGVKILKLLLLFNAVKPILPMEGPWR